MQDPTPQLPQLTPTKKKSNWLMWLLVLAVIGLGGTVFFLLNKPTQITPTGAGAPTLNPMPTRRAELESIPSRTAYNLPMLDATGGLEGERLELAVQVNGISYVFLPKSVADAARGTKGAIGARERYFDVLGQNVTDSSKAVWTVDPSGQVKVKVASTEQVFNPKL